MQLWGLAFVAYITHDPKTAVSSADELIGA